MEQDLCQMLKDCRGDAGDTRLVRGALDDLRNGMIASRASKLKRMPLVGTTIASCMFAVLDKTSFDIMLVDEASQIPEPSCMLPVSRFDPGHLMLVGDPKQLSPTLRGRPIDQGGGGEGGGAR